MEKTEKQKSLWTSKENSKQQAHERLSTDPNELRDKNSELSSYVKNDYQDSNTARDFMLLSDEEQEYERRRQIVRKHNPN